MIKQFAMGLVWSLVAVPRIAEENPKLAIWFVVGLLTILALLGVYGALRYALERRAIKGTLKRLRLIDNVPSSREWTLPAPESYMLLRGVARGSSDAFKLGLLQLMAAGVLIPEDRGAAKETVLRQDFGSTNAVTGSLEVIICHASTDTTVKEVARGAKRVYGSMNGFATKVVLTELVEAGLYTLHPTVLTPEGERVRNELETRMASALREMHLHGGSWVGQEPRWALMAAVIGVAVGLGRLSEEAELQLVGMQVDQGATLAGAQDASLLQDEFWLDWHIFNQVDRYFQAIDGEVDAGESGGDAADAMEAD